MITYSYPFIILETLNNSLVFEIKKFDDPRTAFNKGKFYITQRYYGDKLKDYNLEPIRPLICPYGSNQDYNPDFIISSTFGNCNNSESLLLLSNPDNTYINRFFYESYRIIDGGYDIEGPHARKVSQTLEIVELDSTLNIELHHFYSIFDDSDVIVSKKQIVNKNEKPININRLFSLELPIDSKKLKVYSFDGEWLFERTRHETILTNGMYYFDSKLGSSSHKHNPFMEVEDLDNNLFYGFNFIYSGNHKEMVEVDSVTHSHVFVGLNDFAFDMEAQPNESFITPEAIMVVAHSLDEITTKMHGFVLNHIIDPKYNKMPRPIIFNNWEGTGMNINEENLTEMAVIASKVGVEQFVMDDGWFKNRIDGSRALGDWVIDVNKFPRGLKYLSQTIKGLNLKYGIWVEPEMICINSDIFRSHPEYASLIPNREPIERRNQLHMDMTNDEVVNYIYDSISKVLDETIPDYAKWDYNRFMSECYSSNGTRKGEFMHRFIMGTYKLMDRFVKAYPNILFESCASGGGRFDLGILYYMPQIWGSDDTNTYYRSFIACGTLAGYPQSSFGAHVSADLNPKKPDPRASGASSSLEDRFNLHAIGAFGYEFDFRKYSLEEQAIMSKQIEFYKEHRILIQYGNYYVVDNIFDNEDYFSFNLVSDNKDEALLVAIETRPGVTPKLWKLKGLDPEYTYYVEARKQYNLKSQFTINMTGKELMEKGLDLGSLYSTTDKEKFDGIYSRMLYIKKI